jgi:hypothetical protein
LEKTVKNTIFLLCFSAFGFLLQAQPNANAVLEPNRVATGDTFVLKVLVGGATVMPREVNFRAWAAVLPPENILSRSGWQKNGAKWVQQFTLIAFDSADLSLPPLSVRFHLGDTVSTNRLALKVVPTPAGAELSDLAPIRDIRRETVQWYDYWPWLLGGLLATGVLFWLSRKIKPQTKKAAPVAVSLPQPTAAPIPARQRALQQLDNLEQRQPWRNGQIREYYMELSLILRGYLERQHQFPALESTTGEIMTAAPVLGFLPTQRQNLRELLDRSDLVKYAQTHPTEDFHKKAIAEARMLVQNA